MSQSQTSTPWRLLPLPSKDALSQEFKGKHLTALRTPAFVIDRAVFARNCARMQDAVNKMGISFRAHLKTHKTVEGTRLQLKTSSGKTDSVVVSTMMEAWNLLQAGLIEDETVLDLLYGMPVSTNKLEDLSTLWDNMDTKSSKARLRILVDHLDQLETLETFEGRQQNKRRWSLFVKVDAGYKRAGLMPGSKDFKRFVERISQSPCLSLHGFYCHAGDSYSSASADQASAFLTSEIETVNAAAKIAKEILNACSEESAHTCPLVLSVGSTPTAHAACEEAVDSLMKSLHGSLELHAGNYPLLDLQQVSTGMADQARVAHRVLATVISYYPGRGPNGENEAMCDAGAIAMSKDTGPSGGFGDVIGRNWKLYKVSQEHGILRSVAEGDPLRVGEQIQIIGQHACLIAAAHPWYYITDSSSGLGDTVVDVWVPWKGW